MLTEQSPASFYFFLFFFQQTMDGIFRTQIVEGYKQNRNTYFKH